MKLKMCCVVNVQHPNIKDGVTCKFIRKERVKNYTNVYCCHARKIRMLQYHAITWNLLRYNAHLKRSHTTTCVLLNVCVSVCDCGGSSYIRSMNDPTIRGSEWVRPCVYSPMPFTIPLSVKISITVSSLCSVTAGSHHVSIQAWSCWSSIGSPPHTHFL